MKELVVYNSALTDFFPESVCCSLENLTSLCLRKSSITMIPPHISALKSIKRLDMSDNQLICIGDISKLSTLEELIIDHNNVLVMIGYVHNLVHLKKLSAKMNTLETLPACMNKMKNLEVIDLTGNPLRLLPDYLTKSNNFYFNRQDKSMDSLSTYLYSIDFDDKDVTEDYTCKLMFVGDGIKNLFYYLFSFFY